MKKVNIGFFGTRGLGNYGGFETIGKKLDEKLDGNFFNFIVSKEQDEVKGYKIEKINEKTSLLVQGKTFFRKISKELDNIVNEGRILRKIKKDNFYNLDVILQCGSTPGLTMGKINKNKNPIILWNPDGMEWKRAKFPKYAQIILYYSTVFGIKNSHGVTVDSKTIAKDLKKIIGNKPVYYLPSGADVLKKENLSLEYLKEYGLKSEEYYIVVARAVPENHIKEILEYFSEVKTLKKLIVVCNFGEDEYSNDCIKLINASENIVYKGPIYDSKKLDSLRYYAYGYIHGHSVGGTNPSLLEALGAGNPCICYNVGYNKEVAKDAGLYFNNKKSFKTTIEELENNKEKQHEMKNRAVEIIEENFNWNYIGECHEAVVMDILLREKKIEEQQFQEWLLNKKYREKLSKINFGRL